MLFKVVCRNRAELPEAVQERFGLVEHKPLRGVPSAFKRLHSVEYEADIETIGELVDLARESGDSMILSGDGMVLSIGPERVPE